VVETALNIAIRLSSDNAKRYMHLMLNEFWKYEFCLFIVKVQSNVECFLCFYEFWKGGTRGKNAQQLRQKAAQAQKTRVCSFCVNDTVLLCFLM
jgi:hypothetical protein